MRKIKYTGALALLLMQAPAWAQEAAAEGADAAKEAAAAPQEGWFYWGVAIALFLLLFFLIVVMRQAAGIGKEATTVESFSFATWWRKMDERFFTKAIPVEKEKDYLLDHNYDGIQELDNSLPPWWKWGFYISVVVAVIYMLRFHVWGTGPTPEQEYKTEMTLAAAQIEEYRKQSNDMVDEKTVTMADAAGIADGAKIYGQSCLACHGAKGEGGVGPNLTDDYWLHGGAINDVFKTIKFGVPDKGMQAWEKMFTPSQIKNLSSFIKSIKGTNPPNGKAAQGELFKQEAIPADSTAVALK